MLKKFKIRNPSDLDAAFSELYEIKDFTRSKTLTYEDNEPLRTLDQNAYLHVCISIFAINTGYTLSEAKSFLKRQCDFMHYVKNDMIFEVETHKQKVSETKDFISWIKNYAGMQGIDIPDAETYKVYHSYFADVIKQNKEYL